MTRLTRSTTATLTRRITGAVALAFAVTLGAPDAGAVECAERGFIVKQLDKKFKEGRIATGIMAKHGLMELYVSKDTGTWTVLLTSPRGLSCVIAAGENWESMPVKIAGPAA